MFASSRLKWVGAGLLVFLASSVARGQHKFVELSQGNTQYRGKILARSPESVCLCETDGRLHLLSLKDVTAYRKISDQFVPESSSNARDRLRRELGGKFDVVGTGHYLVAGPSAQVRAYAHTFEEQYRAVHHFFSVRNFDIHEPEFPLMAIIFPDFSSFRTYASKDGVKAAPGLRGYYIQSSNRVALYYDHRGMSTTNGPFHRSSRDLGNHGIQAGLPLAGLDRSRRTATASFFYSGTELQNQRAFVQDNSWAEIEGSLESTMIHEATHQVAFNIGIHPRLGNVNPRWVVEGLALAFEAPGMRSTTLERTPGAKWNPLRLQHFREFLKTRQPRSLTEFIQSDKMFLTNVLDAYAEAWALTFFLVETRPREYSQLLKLIAARSAFELYREKDRLNDFQNAFGKDLILLEANFLRFMSEQK